MKIEEWITKWWFLWILFFIFTSSVALIIQFVIPHVLPNGYFSHGLFVPDSVLFHQIAAQKALEIAEKGWSAWEMRPQGQNIAGITSIFYYLWKPEPFTIIPFNAAIHATAGCIMLFLLSPFMKNHSAAACGATLFIINPVSLEWTTQIHRDGIYILGSLLMLSAWLLLIKGSAEKKWLNLLYSLLLIFLGSFLIWVSRPYWNQMAFVSCILVFVLILFYWVFNFRKSLFPLRWLAVNVLTGCLMILVILYFISITYLPEINYEKDVAKIKSGTNFQIRNAIPENLEKIKNKLNARQDTIEKKQNELLLFASGNDYINIKKEIKRPEVAEKNYNLFSKTDLENERQKLLRWEKDLENWEMNLQHTEELKLKWQKTSYLPNFIDIKLYGIWIARQGTVRSRGNTLIDPSVTLNSAVAFIYYLPRAMQIGLLSPFPTEWLRTGSAPAYTIGKRIVGSTMIFFYVCFVFFLWGWWEYRKNLEFWIIILYCILGLLAFTYTYANVGTLSRLRYGFFMIIVGIGFSFAITKIKSRFRMVLKR